jgi:hypothetical protein
MHGNVRAADWRKHDENQMKISGKKKGDRNIMEKKEKKENEERK